jgi:hypothetical protein
MIRPPSTRRVAVGSGSARIRPCPRGSPL